MTHIEAVIDNAHRTPPAFAQERSFNHLFVHIGVHCLWLCFPICRLRQFTIEYSAAVAAHFFLVLDNRLGYSRVEYNDHNLFYSILSSSKHFYQMIMIGR